jgi:hypothetical protein
VHDPGLIYSGIRVATGRWLCAFDNYSRAVGPRSRQILEGLLARQPDHRRRGDQINLAFGGRFLLHLLTAAIGTFRTWRDVRLESVMRSKADVCRHLRIYEFTRPSQIRVLTITNRAKRVENMLTAVNEITTGKGSNFFLFASAERTAAPSRLCSRDRSDNAPRCKRSQGPQPWIESCRTDLRALTH